MKTQLFQSACVHVRACVRACCHVRLFATAWAVAHQAPLSMGFSRQEYWSGLPFPSPGDLPDPGIESPALAGRWGFFVFCLTASATYILESTKRNQVGILKTHASTELRIQHRLNSQLEIAGEGINNPGEDKSVK